jgi:hypothetical protein
LYRVSDVIALEFVVQTESTGAVDAALSSPKQQRPKVKNLNLSTSNLPQNKSPTVSSRLQDSAGQFSPSIGSRKLVSCQKVMIALINVVTNHSIIKSANSISKQDLMQREELDQSTRKGDDRNPVPLPTPKLNYPSGNALVLC